MTFLILHHFPVVVLPLCLPVVVHLRTEASYQHRLEHPIRVERGFKETIYYSFPMPSCSSCPPLAETVTVGQALETVTHFLDLIQHLVVLKATF